MSSYSEWLGRKMQNERKFLDTRPHRDAGHHTETIKRQATVAIGRRPTGLRVMPASGYTDYVGGVGYRTATAANTKAPQIAEVCTIVREPVRVNKTPGCCRTCGVVNGANSCTCVTPPGLR
jgi:hypothetical protein